MDPIRRFISRHVSHERQLALKRAKRRALGLLGIKPLRFTNYGITSEESRLGLLWPWNYEVSRLPQRMPSGRPWPRISVITPSYNHGAFLEETIRSVLQQGYPDLEYIVVDGGSTDNTSRILERYRPEISLIIAEPDRGQADAINKGLRRATGEILCWLNSDDQHLPHTLASVARAFDAHRTDMVVGGTALTFDYERRASTIHHCVLPEGVPAALPLDRLADFEGEWQRGNFFFQPEVFWTRELWERSGGHLADNLRYAMDYELWLRFAAHGATAVHVAETLAIFRRHRAQKTKWQQHEVYPEHVAVSRLYSGRGDGGAPGGAREIGETVPRSVLAWRPVSAYATDSGTFLVPDDALQDEAAVGIRGGRTYRADRIELARAHVRPGTVVLEVGAGFGQSAAQFSRMVGSHGQVLCFEADEYCLEVLQENLRRNDLQNVRAFHGAVLDGSRDSAPFPKPERLRFPSYSTQRVDPAGAAAVQVPSFSIDQLGISAPVSFMHVDTGGTELFVLRGARGTLERYRLPVLFEFDEGLHAEYGAGRSDLDAFLADIGYEIVRTIQGFVHLAVPRSGVGSFPPEVEPVRPAVSTTAPPSGGSLCKLLRSRMEVDDCSRYLRRNGFVSHNLRCKDWDLAHIIPEVGDGHFLDMGSSDSYILKNLSLKRNRGELWGIDLRKPDVPINDVHYVVGDLMETGLPDGHFSNIACLSVLEHEVDYERFAREVSRLLARGGCLFVTFDYWEPRVTPPVKLYGLAWQPLDRALVQQLLEACARHGLDAVQEFDWSVGEPVIRWGYYSPHPDMSYTFGLAVLRKR